MHQTEYWIGAAALVAPKKTSESFYVANAQEITVRAIESVKLQADVEGTYTDLDISNLRSRPCD